MSRRVGIFGGMFDPIHRGHQDVMTAAESALGVGAMYIVPAKVPPHRPAPIASSFHRFAMVALAIAGRPTWQASDLELLADGPSFTSRTLRAFHQCGFEPADLFFVTGADAFLEIETWKDYPAFVDWANFAVISRRGVRASEMPSRLPALSGRMTTQAVVTVPRTSPVIVLLDGETADVSSTAIRERCARGETLAGLVDPAVQQHIEQHGLYGAPTRSPHQIDQQQNAAAGRMHAQSRQREP